MISPPAGVRVWLASGVTDMRKCLGSLSLLVQEQMKLDPHAGHLFVFRGRQGGLIKVIWHDGQGPCLCSRRSSNEAGSSSPRPQGSRSRCRRRSSAIFLKGSTGGCRSRHGDHSLRDKALFSILRRSEAG